MLRLKREATLDDLERVPEGYKAEIVNGKLLLQPPPGEAHGRASFYITARLVEYEERTDLGYAVPDQCSFVVNLPHRLTFSPDAAFVVAEIGGYPSGAPAFAVEIRSASEYRLRAERAMAAKRAEYFTAGTRVVWDVDVLREGWVRSYRAEAPDDPTIFTLDDMAHAEPALPYWRMGVSAMMTFVHRRPKRRVLPLEPFPLKIENGAKPDDER